MADKYEDEILEGEVSDDDDQEENKKEPEKYCTLCHRAESQVGKMIDLPNNIHICPDCMQRSFDSMNQQMQTGNFITKIMNLMKKPGRTSARWALPENNRNQRTFV